MLQSTLCNLSPRPQQNFFINTLCLLFIFMNNADQAQYSSAVMLIKSMQENKDTVKDETLESNRIDPCRSVLAHRSDASKPSGIVFRLRGTVCPATPTSDCRKPRLSMRRPFGAAALRAAESFRASWKSPQNIFPGRIFPSFLQTGLTFPQTPGLTNKGMQKKTGKERRNASAGSEARDDSERPCGTRKDGAAGREA